MRRVRPQRRSFIDLQRITIGDYLVLASALLTFVSLFLPWITLNGPPSHSEWAFKYSEIAAVIVIVFMLATIFLVIYPALSSDLGLPVMPFSTPVIFLTMGGILVLLFSFELGKYACVLCVGESRGIGLWLAFVSAWVFIIGAVVRWGSRPAARQRDGATFADRGR